MEARAFWARIACLMQGIKITISFTGESWTFMFWMYINSSNRWEDCRQIEGIINMELQFMFTWIHSGNASGVKYWVLNPFFLLFAFECVRIQWSSGQVYKPKCTHLCFGLLFQCLMVSYRGQSTWLPTFGLLYFVKKKRKERNNFNVYDTLGPCLTSTFQSFFLFFNRSSFLFFNKHFVNLTLVLDFIIYTV